jgi:hypothetical protein
LSTVRQQAVDLLKAAHDLIGSDEADADPTLAAIRAACRMGLDAASPRELVRPTLASWGEPGRRTQKWMLHFEDAEVGTIVYDAALYGEKEAELLAREAYRTATVNWNCTLLRVAALDPFDEDRQRTRANVLEASLRELRAKVETAQPTYAEDVDMRVRAAVALGDVTPEQVPIELVLTSLRPANAKQIAEKRRELQRHLEGVATMTRLDARDPAEDGQEDSRRRDRARHDEEKTFQLERDLARLVRIEKSLVDDPGSLLLPLGTVVRVAGFDATTMLDTDWPLPIGGSKGVVTGYSTLAGRPNVVSFVEKVLETSGSAVLCDDERPHSVNYLPEELIVDGHGTLHDGAIVDRPGWWPTHGHGTRGEILYSESMVVESAGRLWRIQPCSGPPVCTQITTADEEGRERFSHLVPLVGTPEPEQDHPE